MNFADAAILAVLAIPALAAALLAFLPNYRIGAAVNVAAAFFTFLAAASLLFQRPALGQCHIRQNGISTQATFDEIAHRVILHLAGADDAFAHQQLDMAVIAGSLAQPAGAQMVHAAVAHMRPIGGSLLHNAHRTGGTRAHLQRQSRRQSDDARMRSAERQVQETERVHQRLGRLPEALDHRLLRHLGGPLAIGVTAHAIAGNQQRGLIGHGDTDAILVGFATALKTEFRIFDPHAISSALH